MKLKLISKTLNIKNLTSQNRDDMFNVFTKYYDNVSYDQFQADLSQKDAVFLLLDKATRAVKGFSTIVKLKVESNGKEVNGLFSGDTIIEKEYWGQGTLGKAFLKYLFIEKLKAPHKDLYWYLISKGFKTYLLMANNYDEYYPRFDLKTPKDKKNIIDQFSQALYSNYDAQKGLILASGFKKEKDKLKDFVSPINQELIENNPKIAHFAKLNPEWMEGDELACIAKMTLSMPFKYQAKLIKKGIFNIFHGGKKPILIPAKVNK